MLESYWPVWLAVHATRTDDSRAEHYVDYLDGRIVSAFFLGCVLMSSLQYVTYSAFLRDLCRRLGAFLKSTRSSLRSTRNDIESPTIGAEKRPWRDERETRSLQHSNDHSALVFTLNLSFILASLAMLLSVLSYGDQMSGSETLCAFVVAWGGMAAQLTRLIGFIILIVELCRMGVKKWEPWLLWGMLFVALALIFAFNATNTGTTSTALGVGTVFCYRRHYIPTALASSITHFVIEMYLFVRLLTIRVPRRARLRERLVGSKALAVARVCSLAVLDVLTIVPDTFSTNVFAQFIPFSVGAILVLAVFNRKSTYIRSPLPSLVINGQPRPATDLLAPTPFTLHFSQEEIREEVETHRWSSRSPHAPPSSRRHSQVPTERTRDSLELASTQSVENAVVSRASAAWRRSVKKLSLPVLFPQSAPAQIDNFPSTSQPQLPHALPQKILQSQVEIAEQFEQEERNMSRTAEPLPGLMPPTSQRPHVSIEMIEESGSSAGSASEHTMTPASAVYGSDIIQLTSDRRRADAPAAHSPSYTQSSFMMSPPMSRRSTYRYSFASSGLTVRTSDESLGDERETSTTLTMSPRTSRSRSFLSPQSSTTRSPRRSFNRYSFASIRSKRDELPTVREVSPDGRSSGSKKPARRRLTFGSSSFSIRRSKKGAVTDILVPPEPMPLSAAYTGGRALEPEEPALAVPEVQLCPATPDPAVSAPPSATSPRLWGKVKGPRPLPSALLPGSAWLLREDSETVRELSRSRSRRYSYPSAASQSQESLRSVVDLRRPSA